MNQALTSFIPQNRSAIMTALTIALALAIPALVIAGAGGTEFNTIYGVLSGWMTGTLGKIITVALIITGVAMGVVRQTVIAAVPGIAAGLVMAYAPGVIDNILTAII